MGENIFFVVQSKHVSQFWENHQQNKISSVQLLFLLPMLSNGRQVLRLLIRINYHTSSIIDVVSYIVVTVYAYCACYMLLAEIVVGFLKV